MRIADAARRAAARPERSDTVLAAALALQLLPLLLLLQRVVTVDGPAHLLGASVLNRYGDAGAELVRRFYEVDLRPVPNLLTTFVLAGLLHVLGPDAAERLLVGGYVVLLVLGLRYALRGLDPRAGWLAVAALPFVGNYLFYYGFYNFCLALGLALLVVGLALRRRAGWSPLSCLALAALLLVTWSAHLLPLLVAGLFVAVLSLARVVADRAAGERPARAVVRHLLGPALAGVPVLALTLVFLASSAAERGEPVRRSWVDLVTGLVTLGRPLVVYSYAEYVPAVAVAATLAVLAVRARGRPRTPERLALAVTAALCTVLYALSPDRYGPEYGFLNDRWSFFPPLFLLLWAAGPPPGPRARRAVVGALLGAAVALTAIRVPTEVRYQRDVAELLSVTGDVPQGSALVRLQLWRDPPVGGPVRNSARDPLRHEPSRLAVLVDGVDVGHYEAVYGYFPTRFRPGDDPRRRLDPTLVGLDSIPPVIDLDPAGDVDVVLVIGRNQAAPEVLADPQTRVVLAQLEAGYERTAVSERSGLVEVWQRR
jgi:hypothetical protein